LASKRRQKICCFVAWVWGQHVTLAAGRIGERHARVRDGTVIVKAAASPTDTLAA